MVEFDIIEDADIRAIEKKFAAFIKKSRVIFITFTDEVGGWILGSWSGRRPAPLRKIPRNATNEKSGMTIAGLEQPGGE